ncbi:hypothetical protein FHS18_004613 [Paenibacillus phyllosphaerae]|uniref:Uncharacterized protein n=1 Tax=Paenibacillus phyllosphaerae TaxID=274593 RepID=A0A7W5FPS5_9BACL|nr:hypothetical protein [Paenibacillus phyllosphaerae]MBB3112512.1 hypothetical protein [Paenibacillus phyllosphaerae]
MKISPAWVVAIIGLVVLLLFVIPAYRESSERKANLEVFMMNLGEVIRTKSTFQMTDVATFEWDYMYMFRPYTPSADMEKAVGSKWDPDELTDDLLHQLVFVKDDQVVLDVTLDRQAGDFTQSKDRIERSDDWFVIEKKEEQYNRYYKVQDKSVVIRNAME